MDADMLASNPESATLFIHPLARSAKVFIAHDSYGAEQKILAIVTTLELNPKGDRYKKHLVAKLSRDASEYLRRADHVTAFVLMNRPRDWPRAAVGYRRHSNDSNSRAVPHTWL